MKTLKELREERQKTVDAAGAILGLSEKEDRDFTDDEQKQYDAFHKERHALESRITRRAEQEQTEADLKAEQKRLEAAEHAQNLKPVSTGVLPNQPNEPTTAATFNEPFRPAERVHAEPKKPVWESGGEFLHAVYAAANPHLASDPRLAIEAAATGASEAVPSDAGFLVGTQTMPGLLKRVYEAGQVSSRVKNIPIGPGFNALEMDGVDETSRATGSRWGGARAYWLNEADDITKSKVKTRHSRLVLEKVAALTYATEETIEDATAYGALVNEMVPEELNFALEDAIIEGEGSGKPLGILNSGCLISVPKETGQLAATIVADNIVKMWARLWARSQQNAVWYINQDTFPQLYTMGLVIGTGGAPMYMPPNGLSGSPYSTLMGRPVIPIEYCSTLGTVGDIILADMSGYLTITKGGTKTASSIHVKFISDQQAFRWILRVNGQPLWDSALTPFKGTKTTSPFVALATRA